MSRIIFCQAVSLLHFFRERAYSRFLAKEITLSLGLSLFMVLILVSCRPAGWSTSDQNEAVSTEQAGSESVIETLSGFDSYQQPIPGSELSIKMVPVPGGTFLMGRNTVEEGKEPHEGPQRTVSVEPFWMAAHEITWDQYQLFVSEVVDRLENEVEQATLKRLGMEGDEFLIPSPPYGDLTHGMGTEGYPVINITHFAAIEYARWLSARTGYFFRLPTEAEWEFACRGGSPGKYSFGEDTGLLDEYEWYRNNAAQGYGQVMTRKPNAYGLYDMQGNVAEWTMDQYLPDYHELLGDTTSHNPWFRPDDLYPRTIRGGSWRDEAQDIRCTTRRGSSQAWSRMDPQIPKSMWWHTNAPFVGFRLIRPLNKPPAEKIQPYWIEPRLDF